MFLIDPCEPLPDTAAALVDELSELEAAKAMIAARQARATAALDDLDTTSSDRGVGAQIGLARKESPHRGRRLLSLGRALTGVHAETLALLEAGLINEHRAELITSETRDLAPEQRRAVDRTVAGIISRTPDLGDKAISLLARRVVMRHDPEGSSTRREKARGRRRVGVRYFGDGTAQVTGTVSDVHAAAIMESLSARAATVLALGDPTLGRPDDPGPARTRAQIIADLFVERLTGRPTADCAPLTINLTVSAETLLGDGDEPAEIPGAGPIPAPVARKMALASPAARTKVRRLFVDTDHLVAMESTTRLLDGLLRAFIALRDHSCRTPFCDAAIRDDDHVVPYAEGGPTSAHNAQGTCRGCNLTKSEPGWASRVVSTEIAEAHEVETTTPTGHTHRSRAPDPPRESTDTVAARYGFRQTRPGLWTRVA